MLGHGEFANVVQERGGMQGFQFRAGHAEFLADFDGVDADALQVFVGRVIFGFDGEGQGLDRAQMEVSHLFHVALLVCEFAQIEAVRAVDQVDHRQNEQRRFPVEVTVKPGDHACDCGADQVVGKRPEIAVHQDAPQRTAFGQRNDGGDGSGIGDEIDRRGQSE